MTYTNYLQEQFKQLQLDSRFGEMMVTNQACLLQLWILEIQTESGVSLRLLYCWILPNSFANGKWSKADIMLDWKPNTKAYKANIYKYSFYAEGATISSLIEELIQGTSISEVCTKLSLSHPHKRLEPFTLGNPRAIAQNYAVRPAIFLETETSLHRIQDASRPMKSPSNEISALSASLVFLQKLRIWKKDELSDIPLDDADALAIMSITKLMEETGFTFNGSDSSRLGNIEWFAFPLSDRETVPADFSTIKSDIQIPNNTGLSITKKSSREVDVFLNKSPATSCRYLLVRCRLYNHHDVTTDQVRLVHLKQAKRGVRFTANQEISQVRLTIWINSGEKRNWEIWFEQEVPLMREVNMAMGIRGLQGKVKLSTLQGFANSDRVKERIQQYEQVSQTSYQQSAIGDYSLDPWVSASRQIQDYVKQLFPPASKGRFFPKGWGHDGPGVLSFAEWFSSLTNRTTGQLITIVDPYFDTVGIELIAHSSTTNTAFEIITCTQTNSKDDVIENSRLQRFIGLLSFFQKKKNTKQQDQKQDSEPSRAMRILKACADLRLVLSRLNLAVWDIRSERGGNSSLFHDRYIIIFDGNNHATEGYHLSNSIQAATKFDPMLVTPIPVDILDEVASYVVQVANAESPAVEKAMAIQLYPRNNTRNIPGNSVEKGQNLVLETTLFWAELLEKPELVAVPIQKVAKHLKAVGFLDADGQCFTIKDEELMDKLLQNLAINLQDMERDKFPIVWEQFSVWLANVPGSDIYLEKLCNYSNQTLGRLLINYLSGSVWPSFEEIKVNQELLFQRYFSYFQSDYKDGLDDSFYFLDGHFDLCLLGHFHLEYAVKALLSIEPEYMIDILETLKNRLECDLELDYRNAILVSYLLHELIIYLMFDADKKVIKRMLLSSTSVLRALGSQAEWFSSVGSLDIPLLSELNPVERLFAYAEWIYHMRVQMNRGGETEELKNVKLGIFQQIIKNWQTDLKEYDKCRLINRLCGPSKGGWASDIYQDLMIPLVQAGLLSSDEAILFWMELLIEKFEGKDPFYGPTDQPLTELCAKLYSELSAPTLNTVEKRIRKRIMVINREIRRPFAKSHNFEVWNEAKLTGVWNSIFLELALRHGSSNETELKELLETLDKQLRDYTYIPNQELAIFAEEQS